MYTAEEMLYSDILNKLYAKLDIEEKLFEHSLEFYLQDHAAEIKEITNLTEQSMQQLKYNYYGIAVPSLPAATDDQIHLMQLVHHSISV